MPPKSPARDLLLQHLRTNQFFEGLEADVVHDLAGAARWYEYEAGEVVVLEGEAPHGLFFLQFGWLKVVKTSAAGREQTLRFLEPGETFNEIGVFTSLPNPATAIALEPAGVWLIPRASLLRLLRERPEFSEQLVAKMAVRMLYLVNLVTDLSLHTVTARLARLLLESADANGRLPRPRWYTQAELAARLGTVPDVVQRALRELEGNGLIQVERYEIRIVDRAALAALAP
jgi:CRP/FNR family transcriptional regulator